MSDIPKKATTRQEMNHSYLDDQGIPKSYYYPLFKTKEDCDAWCRVVNRLLAESGQDELD